MSDIFGAWDVYSSFGYWCTLAIALYLQKAIIRFRWGDFCSIICIYLAQFVAHSLVLFGYASDIFLFVALFGVLFAGTMRVAPSLVSRRLVPYCKDDATSEILWFRLCRLYLIAVLGSALLLAPPAWGEFDAAQRLVLQEKNRWLVYLSTAYLPAFAACAYMWIAGRRRFGVTDLWACAITAAFALGSGSKASLLPLVLTLVGIASLDGVQFRIRRRILLLGLFGLIASWIRLVLYFPEKSAAEVLSLLGYRLLSNTDSLTYLNALGRSPSEFPFSGLGALAPPVAKVVGSAYEYSPGVWLYGSATGDWRGFGPNSGFVIDYFGNLGWAGCGVAVALGVHVALLQHARGPMGVSFLAVAYLALIDVSLFSVVTAVWGLALTAFVLVRLLITVSWERYTRTGPRVAGASGRAADRIGGRN